MALTDELVERFKASISPELMRSRWPWLVALALSRSPMDRPSLRADRVSSRFMLESTRDAYLGRRPVVWSSLLFPSELIHGTGNIAFFPEIAAAKAASVGLSRRFLDAAEAAGFSQDLCSFHRVLIGAATEDLLPHPDLLVSSSQPCDSSPLSFEFLADYYGVEHLTADVPNENSSVGELEILAGELRRVALALDSLDGATGGNTGGLEERMRDAVELSNRARRFALEVERERKRVPSPLDGWNAMGHLAVLAMMPGTRAGASFYAALAGELKDDAYAGLPGKEKHRLLWMHLKPYFPSELETFLHEKGAVIVCEEYNRCFWGEMDPDRPFDSLAAKAAGHFSAGTAERRAAEMVRLAEEYEVDGAVHFSHRGCRQSCGSAQQVREELARVGVRTLILDGECLDPREHRDGQIRTRLEAFLETLDNPQTVGSAP
ncbi:MAG: 2-hydroxyacyl-CoA dehydratase family protein [Actinobacteria bacterium]|nr:2-hydroxyacyl-CoA dehydratase family protein [Actinomycetota bacterium]